MEVKSLTSKAVPPDRRLPNQLHGWLAKSALNPPHPKPFLFSPPLSKVQAIYFIATFTPALVSPHSTSQFPFFFFFSLCPVCEEKKVNTMGKKRRKNKRKALRQGREG